MSETPGLPRPARAHPALRAGGRADHHLDRRQRAAARRPDPARARARPAPRRQPRHPEPGAGRPRGDRGRGGAPRRRHRGHPVAHPAHRRGDPGARRPDPRDHRHPRRARDQDRGAGGGSSYRRGPGAHRRGPRGDGGRHRGRRPRGRGRRTLPRRRHDGSALAAAGPADGRDRRPDQGDPDRVAVPARPAARVPRRAPGDRRGDPGPAARGGLRGDARPRRAGQRRRAAARAPSRSDRLGGDRRTRGGVRGRHPDLDRRRRLAAELPGAAGRRAATGRGQRLQHRRDDAGWPERVLRLPTRAQRASAHHGHGPAHLRRRVGGRRPAPAGAAAGSLRGRGALADPGDQRPGRHPALDQRPAARDAAATTSRTACGCRR